MKHQRRKIRRTAEDKVMDTVIFILMTLILLVTLYPFYYVIIISFNDGVDALNGGIYFWPRKFTLANYQQFLSDAKWLHALLISTLKTVAGTTLTILFTCMVGYGLSAPNLMFRKFYNVVLLICMYFSGGLIPYYLVLNSYGYASIHPLYYLCLSH
ncbi:hypothetical protein KQI61_03960 [Anaerocolumna aminovalerica]|uniref:hypothetical protein n=1 Tax=Anaerocolumna aminovalerica TaxID=1527 RepID=UPI001C0EAEC3|nr:hypothetical protein [Anaerocolumna aminovalerica]MBU5331341.1 hypothetical protein [Anaerocolumna aminovalerica]